MVAFVVYSWTAVVGLSDPSVGLCTTYTCSVPLKNPMETDRAEELWH